MRLEILAAILLFTVCTNSYSQLIYRQPRVNYSSNYLEQQGIHNTRELCKAATGVAVLNTNHSFASGNEVTPNLLVFCDIINRRIISLESSNDYAYVREFNNSDHHRLVKPTKLCFDGRGISGFLIWELAMLFILSIITHRGLLNLLMNLLGHLKNQ